MLADHKLLASYVVSQINAGSDGSFWQNIIIPPYM